MRPRQPAQENTSFQEHAAYDPRYDVKADVAMAYGVEDDLAARLHRWREAGYISHVMTGVSWGEYQDYVRGQWDGTAHYDDAQHAVGNFKLEHGIKQGRDVFYMVPTVAYTVYLFEQLKQVVDAGALAIHLEEPEFWVRSGYGKSFEQEWARFYGEPWQDPNSSPDARYRASKLQQFLYIRALTTLCHDLKVYAREKGNLDFRCYVPTHSLLNYAHWRIVSPESRLMDIEDCDGLIAQVWTGTARTPNYYRGALAERTFETAFCEYASAAAMVRGTDKHLWFLADPIEDNPNCSWDDYRRNWECTVAASLFFPEVSRFEVVPWPRRVYTATYPKASDLRDQPLQSVVDGYVARLSQNDLRDIIREAVAQFEHFVATQVGKRPETLGFGAMPPRPDEPLRFGDVLAYAFPFYQHLNATLDQETAERLRDALSNFYHDPTSERQGIPPAYATELGIVFNALADMSWPEQDTEWLTPDPGVGLCIADSLMFQRGEPDGSDNDLSSVYGVALPLIKHGIPLHFVQLERVAHSGYLDRLKILLLTYEGMKPGSPSIHELLATWVKNGGMLVVFGVGDVYNTVREWWNQDGRSYTSPQQHLYAALGIAAPARSGTYGYGAGKLILIPDSPAALAHDPSGADQVVRTVKEVLGQRGISWTESNALVLRRGPYVIAAGLDAPINRDPLTLQGQFINLFDAAMPVVHDPQLVPDSQWFLYDLQRCDPNKAWVIAVSGRVSGEQATDHQIAFTTSYVLGATCAVRVLLPAPPKNMQTLVKGTAIDHQNQWDADTNTLLLAFDSNPDGVLCEIRW